MSKPSPTSTALRFAAVVWRLQLDGLGAIPLIVVGAVGVVAGLLLSPAEATNGFYGAVVGVIPVLLLTLAVQSRFFVLPSVREVTAHALELRESLSADDVPTLIDETTRAIRAASRMLQRVIFGVGLLGVLVVAEFDALHPLATGRASDGDPQLSYIAMTTGFLVVCGLALIGAVDAAVPQPAAGTGDDLSSPPDSPL